MLRATLRSGPRPRALIITLVALLSLMAMSLPLAVRGQDAGAGTVSGAVWTDVNTDGVRNRAEAELGVERVTVVLYEVVDGARVAPEIGQAVTDADGRYLFSDVAPGAYQLAFRLSDEFALTYQDVGDDDLVDSDASQFTSSTDVFGVDEEAGAIKDVGILPDGENVKVEGIVWEDWNGDHEQQIANERGLGGVRVTLLKEKKAKKGKKSTWDAHRVVFSDARNGYRFIIPSGDARYRVQVGLPLGYQRAEMDASPSDLIDSDVDMDNGRAQPAKARKDQVIDAGLAPLSEISDLVWHDADLDGIQGQGEDPLEDVMVVLFELFLDTLVYEEVDDVAAPLGQYAFRDVPPGVYEVGFFPPAPFAATGFQVGDDRYLDSDVAGWALTPTIHVPDDVVDPAVLEQRRQELGWNRPGAGPGAAGGDGVAQDDIVVGDPPVPGAGAGAPPDLRQAATQWWDAGFFELEPLSWMTDIPGAGEVADCESGTAAKDPQVEIVGVSTVLMPDGSRTLMVELKRGHERAYSFASIFVVQTAAGPMAFLYELHEGVPKVGQIDSETGEVIRQNGDGIEILHAPSAGLVFFGIDASVLGDGAENGFVRTFHTAKKDQATRCHGTQPFELPQPPA